jgi:hypothetical protein
MLSLVAGRALSEVEEIHDVLSGEVKGTVVGAGHYENEVVVTISAFRQDFIGAAWITDPAAIKKALQSVQIRGAKFDPDTMTYTDYFYNWEIIPARPTIIVDSKPGIHGKKRYRAYVRGEVAASGQVGHGDSPAEAVGNLAAINPHLLGLAGIVTHHE